MESIFQEICIIIINYVLGQQLFTYSTTSKEQNNNCKIRKMLVDLIIRI